MEERALNTARRIVLDAIAGQRIRVWLFGSRAKQRGTAASDIDIGLLSAKPLPLALLASLREQLEESTIPFAVDVVDLATAEAEFRERVQREGIAWSA